MKQSNLAKGLGSAWSMVAATFLPTQQEAELELLLLLDK